MSRNNEQKAFFNKILTDGPVTILKVKNGHFILEIINNSEAKSRPTIKVASIQAIHTHLKHEPAEAIELEAAIANIEGQLMPIIKDLPIHRCLVTSEHLFWSIARVAGLKTGGNLQLNIKSVEDVFNRLADVAYGTPASRLVIPENRYFAATVLFLREIMHHAAFNFIILR